MALKLIVEAKSFDANPVERLFEKDDNGAKSYYIQGPFIQTNVKNRNGRNYPKPLMVECVQNYINDRMNEKTGFRSYGELGHPDGVEINLDKVCIYVQSFNWQGNDCIGKAKVLKQHPSGRIVETLLEENLRLGVSTRGLGALAKVPSRDGSKLVEAYEMIAVDVVADPSAPQGFVDGILENKQYIIQDNGVIAECFDRLENNLVSLPKDSVLREIMFTEALNKFLKNI